MNTRILPSQDTVAFGQVFHTAARIAETCEEYLQSAVEHVVGHSTRESRVYTYDGKTRVAEHVEHAIQCITHHIAQDYLSMSEPYELSKEYKSLLSYTLADFALQQEKHVDNEAKTLYISERQENTFISLRANFTLMPQFYRTTIADYAYFIDLSFQAVLLWIAQFDMMHDVFLKFSKIFQHLRIDEDALFPADFAVQIAIKTHVLCIFQQVMDQEVRVDLPWEWQSLLLANSIVEYVGDPATVLALYEEASFIMQSTAEDDPL